MAQTTNPKEISDLALELLHLQLHETWNEINKQKTVDINTVQTLLTQHTELVLELKQRKILHDTALIF